MAVDWISSPCRLRGSRRTPENRGKAARIFMTTMGHAEDFKNEGFRRMVVNACYWAMGMEKKISGDSSVEFAAAYNPNPIGLGKQKTDITLSGLK